MNMKILHVISSLDLSIGGPAKSVSDLSLYLAKNGQDITVFTTESDNPYSIDYIYPNLRFIFVSANEFKQQLNDLIRNEKFDILHGHSLWSMHVHYLSVIAQKNNIPYVITPRGTLEPWALNAKKWKKRIAMLLYQRKDLKKAACIHATAVMEAANIRSLGFKNPIAFIPNGVDIPDSYFTRSTKKEDKRTILFLSRIHPKKGIEFLISAWEKIDITIRKDWQIKIVGAGDENYISSLKKLISLSALENEIQLIGPLYGTDKSEVLSNAELFVLPTYSENFGVVVAEALLYGVPVITTVGTPWEELNTHNAGWWIEIGVEPLVKALLHSMQLSETERRAMGENGKKLVVSNYSIQSVASKMVDLYKWMLDKNSDSSFLYQNSSN